MPKQHGLLQGALWPTSGLRCTELRPTDVAPERPNPEMRIDLEGRLRFRAQAMCVSRRWQQEAVVRVPKQHGLLQGALWPTGGLRCTELRPTDVAPERPNPEMRIDLEGRLRFRAQAMCVSRRWQQEAVVRVPKQHGMLPATLRPSGSHRLGVDHAHLLFHSLCGTCQREREAVGQVRRQQGLLSAACQ